MKLLSVRGDSLSLGFICGVSGEEPMTLEHCGVVFLVTSWFH